MINGTMLQGFHWYTEGDGRHWDRLATRAAELAGAGFTAIWLPPAFKAIDGVKDVGYGVYDLYDLGEFHQKGSVRTKYGTREQYLAAIEALHRAGMDVYADIVFNHRMGADALEAVNATPFSQSDRIHSTGPCREIDAWTRFTFPARSGRYSTFCFDHRHFDAVDFDARNPGEKGTIYLLEGKSFDDYVALENGNFAYLMGCDLDCQNEDVRAELEAFGRWYLDTTGVDGFRLDAVKHISSWFFPRWIDAMERHAGRDLFVVGEYWQPDANALRAYVDRLEGRLSAFDVVLHYNFCAASRAGGHYDMRRIFDGALVNERPVRAVTFVDNHDSQPLQALESAVEPWFKPLAYGLILLRESGYPCVFLPDYDGAAYEDRRGDSRCRVQLCSHRAIIDRLLWARRHCAFGEQRDYFYHENVVGWTRCGDAGHPRAMAVLLSDGPEGDCWMDVRRSHTPFRDITGHCPFLVSTNADGWGDFHTRGGAISVWVEDNGSDDWPA